MPPKKGQSSKAETKARAEPPTDDTPLQAVILADSYNRRFEVLCTDQPRVLLPLCSTPLLSWTLESLSLSKVKQVFIFCGVHADKIREFVESSPYRHSLDIECLASKTAMSAGDALRELDTRSVLNADNPFILVHSPLISNFDLSKMVEAHKARRAVDKNYIMTLGVGRGGRRHPESPIMLVHPPSSRLLHYASHPLVPSQSRLTLPGALFTDPFPPTIDTYEIWSGTSSSSKTGGYRDLGVDICEADVYALCSENFDWHDLRRHLVNGVLTSDLLGKKIAVHLVEAAERPSTEAGSGVYVERVRDTRTFGEISRDVLRRWAFPLVPDLNEPGGVQYELRPGNVYVARDNVLLSRTTDIDGPALIGPRSALSQNTYVSESTLGADCAVGPGTRIERSYVFDEVRIGANCRLEECIVGKNVEIGDGVVVGRGALIGNGVRLGKGVVVPEFARVGRERYRGDDEDDDDDEDDESGGDEPEEAQLSDLGANSLAFLWPQEEEEPLSDDDSDVGDPYEHPSNKRLLQLGRHLPSTPSVTSLSTLSAASSSEVSSAASSTSLPDMPSLSLTLDSGPPPAFYTEARASLERAYDEGHSIENALLELRTLVMGYNAGVDRAREEIVKFLCSRMEESAKGGGQGVMKEAMSVLGRWGGLALGMAGDKTNIALDVQGYCVEASSLTPYFPILLRALYETDILAEEDLLEWRSLSAAKGEGQKDESERAKWLEVYKKGKVYVDLLEGMDSDDEEESEEEDEDEEEDESDE